MCSGYLNLVVPSTFSPSHFGSCLPPGHLHCVPCCLSVYLTTFLIFLFLFLFPLSLCFKYGSGIRQAVSDRPSINRFGRTQRSSPDV